MGFIAPIIAGVTSAVGGAAATAGGALAGATGIPAFGAIGAGANSLIAGTLPSALGSLGTLKGLGTAATLIGSAATLKNALSPPKIPSPPQAPALSSALSKNSLIGPFEGSANGTFLSGTNQRGGSSGGKALLGQ